MKSSAGIIEKIKKMSIKEIYILMIDALENPIVNLNMYSYGRVVNGVPYGCIATNVICKLFQISREEFIILNPMCSMKDIGDTEEDDDFISDFESFIDFLRIPDDHQYEDFYSKPPILKIDFKIDLEFCEANIEKIKEIINAN